MKKLTSSGLVIAMLILSACSAPVSPNPTASSIPPTSEVTFTALPSLTYTLLPTQTPPPAVTVTQTLPPPATDTPTPASVQELPPAPVVPAKRMALAHPKAPDVVFVIDPNLWQVDQPPFLFLRHTQIPDCRIDIAPPMDPALPWRIYSFILGRRNWMVYDYRQTAFFWQPQLILNLINYLDNDCRRDQLAVLTALLSWEEYAGAPTSTPVSLPTLRPPLARFDCPGAQPPRLRVGDQAIITADALWLRSEASHDEQKKLTLYYQFAPVTIDILEGPVCSSGYVYWKAKVSQVSIGGKTTTGWLVESHGGEYYLSVWYLGW
jgi:hypothetical protein